MKLQKYLIVFCGLPGTGKTEASLKLSKYLPGLNYIGQNEVRREFGIKRMPKTQDAVLRAIDRRIGQHLIKNVGVVVDSVNRYLFRRQQMYGIASCMNAPVIILEMLCLEEVAKERIKRRPPGDGLVSDSNDPRIYDKLKSEWEEVMLDFQHPGSDHVSYLQYDSCLNQVRRVIERKGMKRVINIIENILTKS